MKHLPSFRARAPHTYLKLYRADGNGDNVVHSPLRVLNFSTDASRVPPSLPPST